ncbi:hypothetical protein QAD02_001885 [Eretmocerus hayati]|uniref:Uncharacterized protein n=1 Tax=Eretmocerus hayati TaxID=131215 RepID=A0ACC2NHQ3_9HYME|nr:hypothetical protein QAD02_001885 [Eretmocerus hayati]
MLLEDKSSINNNQNSHENGAGTYSCNGGNISVTTSRLISVTSGCWGKLVPYKLTDIGEGIREVTVKEWFVKPGDKVEMFDNICEVQSDKASVTITSRYDGIVRNLHYKLDEMCLVGSALIDIEIEDDASAKKDADQVQSSVNEGAKQSTIVEQKDDLSLPSSVASAALGGVSTRSHDLDDDEQRYPKVLTTPAVRRIAREQQVELSQVTASGRHGRVLKEDILAYLQQRHESSDPKEVNQRVHQPPSIQAKKYAKHMWSSMTQSLSIPHFVYSDECNVSKLVRLRTEVKSAFESKGLSLSYMPFFIKAVSQALLQFPELNAVIDEKTESTNIKKEHNISLAMDTPGGLVVPNIKNVQNLDIIGIARELNRLQEFGKRSSLSPNDLSGGTFSVSNIGIVGGTYTKPVILSPQVVICAIGRIQKLPRFDEHDNVVAANILSVSWAADHRVVDGVTMAKFSNLWRHYVENPSHLIIGI